jgi:hypothetical protein
LGPCFGRKNTSQRIGIFNKLAMTLIKPLLPGAGKEILFYKTKIRDSKKPSEVKPYSF